MTHCTNPTKMTLRDFYFGQGVMYLFFWFPASMSTFLIEKAGCFFFSISLERFYWKTRYAREIKLVLGESAVNCCRPCDSSHGLNKSPPREFLKYPGILPDSWTEGCYQVTEVQEIVLE